MIYYGMMASRVAVDTYMMVLDQYGAVLPGAWWFWVSITWYCLELSGTGLMWGFNAWIY